VVARACNSLAVGLDIRGSISAHQGLCVG
jgi:hypothetical protein